MKTVKYAWLMWVICVTAYVLLAVIIPFQQTSIYWIAVCATLIMFGITRCAYVSALRKGNDTESKLLGWPIFKVAVVANCVQIIISLVFMTISTIISVRLTLCIEIVLFALTLISLVVRSAGREVVMYEESMHTNKAEQWKRIRDLASQLAITIPSTELKKLNEDIRFSDPTPKNGDDDILYKLSQLTTAAQEDQATLIRELKLLVTARRGIR